MAPAVVPVSQLFSVYLGLLLRGIFDQALSRDGNCVDGFSSSVGKVADFGTELKTFSVMQVVLHSPHLPCNMALGEGASLVSLISYLR